MIILSSLIIICFTLFSISDVIAVFPRVSGSIAHKNGLAYSIQVAVQTIKRLFFVLYPPLVGALSVFGDINLLFIVIFASYVCASIGVFVIARRKIFFISYFISVIDRLNDDEKLLTAFWNEFRRPSSIDRDGLLKKFPDINGDNVKVNKKILLLSLAILFFINTSIFMINILNFVFPTFSSVILQLTGLISGIGSVVLAFSLDPLLSKFYEGQVNLDSALKSLLLSHIINTFVLSPLIFLLLWLLVI